MAQAGKHCFVEKPLATSAPDAEAGRRRGGARPGTILMVGHLLEYHPAVDALKQLIDGDELGELYYVYGNRLNLGKLRADENALWSLGAHDVSVALHLIGEEPEECLAHGASYVREGVQDVVFCYLRFPSGIVAHLHLSWLDPHKERRMTVVGARRMATFDDMLHRGQADDLRQGLRRGHALVGRVHRPLGRHLLAAHPQRRAAADRVRALRALRRAPAPRRARTATAALRVVRVLRALQRSLRSALGSPRALAGRRQRRRRRCAARRSTPSSGRRLSAASLDSPAPARRAARRPAARTRRATGCSRRNGLSSISQCVAT